MKFENHEVSGFKNAFTGMRNPLNSWSKADSFFDIISLLNDDESDYEIAQKWVQKEHPEVYTDYDVKDFDAFVESEKCKIEEKYDNWLLKNGVLRMDAYNEYADVAFIGPNDMDLAKRLIKSGPEHAKFLRQIFVSVDITAPLYW